MDVIYRSLANASVDLTIEMGTLSVDIRSIRSKHYRSFFSMLRRANKQVNDKWELLILGVI
jgi:hypothetical protein